MLIDALIFVPARAVPAPPPGVTERWITTADGLRLHAWYGASPGSSATLVWSHGNAGNIAMRLPVRTALLAHGTAHCVRVMSMSICQRTLRLWL